MWVGVFVGYLPGFRDHSPSEEASSGAQSNDRVSGDLV